MNLREAYFSVGILREAGPATQAALISSGIQKRYRKGEHLFLDRTDVKTLYFLVNGVAALYKLNSRQERKVIFICGGGDFINEVILQEEIASINCEFLADSMTLQFPREAFLAAMEQDFELTKSVLNSMAMKIRRLYHQMKNTSNTIRLDKQVASKLWKLSLDFGRECADGVEIRFDLPISFLADMVGSKRETVSRQVKQLTDCGLIEVRKNRFIVKDRDKLLKYFREA